MDQLPEVQAGSAEHQRLQQLLQEIHLLSLALVRTHARPRRRQAGRPRIVGRVLVPTTRPFFPELNVCRNRLPDTRVPEAGACDRRFLSGWGLHFYLLPLGARRPLDCDLKDGGPHVLDNLKRLRAGVRLGPGTGLVIMG